MQKLVLVAAACALAPMQPAAAQAWGVSGEVGVVSDYHARGVSLTNWKPAVQAGASLSHASGVHADLWSSTIARSPKGARVEVDIGIGYGGKLSEAATYDASLLYYHYPSDSALDFAEMQVQLTRSVGKTVVTATVAYAPQQNSMRNLAGRLSDNVYVSGEVRRPLVGTPITLVAATGYENGHFDGCIRGGKIDWQAGIAATMRGMTLGALYVGSNAEIPNDAGRNLAGHRALLSASVSF